MAPLKRDRCEGCGVALFVGPHWYTIHEHTRTLKVCRACLEDSFGRLDAEATYQAELLESLWQLTPRQTGVVDDGDLGLA